MPPHRPPRPGLPGGGPPGRWVAVDLIDLCLAREPETTLCEYFAGHSPPLIPLSFRNADNSFYPSMTSFVPQLVDTVDELRRPSDAPLVLGGSGFSIFAAQIMQRTRADFGIRGDGEEALIALLEQLARPTSAGAASVPGLLHWT